MDISVRICARFNCNGSVFAGIFYATQENEELKMEEIRG